MGKFIKNIFIIALLISCKNTNKESHFSLKEVSSDSIDIIVEQGSNMYASKEINVLNENKLVLKVGLWDAGRVSIIYVHINDSTVEEFGFSYPRTLSEKARLKIINGKYINDGLNCFYYDDGSVQILYTYKNGILDGQYICYYKNGYVETKGQYKNGEEAGTWFYYDEQGNLIKKLDAKEVQQQ